MPEEQATEVASGSFFDCSFSVQCLHPLPPCPLPTIPRCVVSGAVVGSPAICWSVCLCLYPAAPAVGSLGPAGLTIPTRTCQTFQIVPWPEPCP